MNDGWRAIKAHYTPGQVALLRRFSKSGRKGFHVVRSAEAPRAGALKRKPSRFKPSGAVAAGQPLVGGAGSACVGSGGWR